MIEPRSTALAVTEDAWTWWQERRFSYNVAIATAGVIAYSLAIVLHYAFGDHIWAAWPEALSQTIFLGVGYLVMMATANVFYLLGPFGEKWLNPADPAGYRRTAYAMGLWGSCALPFLFPLVNLSFLIG